MTSYEKLTRRGRLRRTRSIAWTALEAYGITKANLKLLVDAGNTTYRVKVANPTRRMEEIYAANAFLLRLHQPGYQNEGAVDSELEWLEALCKVGLPVPQPLRTTSGNLSVEVSVPGVPSPRRCSLLRWVKGRLVTRKVRPWHLTAIGRLIARLHNHASSWQPPAGFVRRHYDRNGLWGNDTGTNFTEAEVWQKIPKKYFEQFKEVTRRVEQVMENWGKGADVYGLIHADLGTKANTLFYGREARPIDFDDAGYGYWVYDLAMPLSDWEGEPEWPIFRDALLEGYAELRSLPEEQLSQLELFQVAIRALEIFWGTAAIMYNPRTIYWRDRRNKAVKFLQQYLKRNPRP